jgi:hypothetical protein
MLTGTSAPGSSFQYISSAPLPASMGMHQVPTSSGRAMSLTPTSAAVAAAAVAAYQSSLSPTAAAMVAPGNTAASAANSVNAAFDAKGEMQRLLAKRPHLRQQMKRILDSHELSEAERKTQMRNLVRMLKEEDGIAGSFSGSNSTNM